MKILLPNTVPLEPVVKPVDARTLATLQAAQSAPLERDAGNIALGSGGVPLQRPTAMALSNHYMQPSAFARTHMLMQQRSSLRSVSVPAVPQVGADIVVAAPAAPVAQASADQSSSYIQRMPPQDIALLRNEVAAANAANPQQIRTEDSSFMQRFSPEEMAQLAAAAPLQPHPFVADTLFQQRMAPQQQAQLHTVAAMPRPAASQQ